MGTVDYSWRREARCAAPEADADAFFNPEREAEAKATCARCPVREPCFLYALETRQEDGVWGGLTERERDAYLQAATPTRGRVPLRTTTYTTRARSTGSTCSAGRTEAGWGVACVTHDNTASARSRTAAENAVSRPEEWCPACRRSLELDDQRQDAAWSS